MGAETTKINVWFNFVFVCEMKTDMHKDMHKQMLKSPPF